MTPDQLNRLIHMAKDIDDYLMRINSYLQQNSIHETRLNETLLDMSEDTHRIIMCLEGKQDEI